MSFTSNEPMGKADHRSVAPADEELFSHIERNLYTAVISDALDDMGIRRPRDARAPAPGVAGLRVRRLGPNRAVHGFALPAS